MTDLDHRTADAEPEPERDGFSTFDDYRARRRREREAEAVTTVILGERVTLPTSLPIGFEMRLHRMADERTTEAEAVELMAELVAMLYGDDALDRWGDDLDVDDLQTLIIWGAANVRSPHSMTFEEAARAAEAAEGKVRTARRSAARSRARRPRRGSGTR